MPIPTPDLDELNPDNNIPEKEAAAIVAALVAFETARKKTLVQGASRAYLRGETVAHKRLLQPLVPEEIKDDVYSFLKTYKGQLDEGYTIIQGEKTYWLKNRTIQEREQIFKIVSEGITEGKSPAVVRKEFQDHFKMQRYQADRIARTETAHVQCRGRDNRYKAHDVEEIKWLCGPAPCQICAPLEGRIFTWDTLPYQQPTHPQCVCDLAPVLKR